MRIHIGTSGWVYPHWRGVFYPAEMREPDWLTFYARHFGSVEINRSFYRLPTRENFTAWRDGTPDDFVFAVKASRFITHMKKLKEPEQALPPLLDALSGLGGKLGPVLFQLPPNWRVNYARLHGLLECLPAGLKVAFEFRNPTWHTQETQGLLTRFNAAYCVHDLGGVESPRITTTNFAYVRLHGPAAAYSGSYGPAALRSWAQWITQQKVEETYVYFDNDQAGYAVQNALALQKILT